MTETTPALTAAAGHQAAPFQISVQYRNEGSEAATDGPAAINWDTFTRAFDMPRWHGKQPLATYCERYDDICECELIPAREWQPVSFKTETTNGDDIKYADNMLLHAVVFDLDGGTPGDEIRGRLRGLKGLVHSTYRHSPTAPRWRVILPLRRAIEASDWLLMRDALLHRFGALLDTEEARQSWSWYRLPACPSDAKEHYTMFQLDGVALRMTPEFQLECARSLHLKLQRQSRTTSPAVLTAPSTADVTACAKTADQPPVATPAAKTPETLKGQATGGPSAGSAASPVTNMDDRAAKPETPGATIAVASPTDPTRHEDLMDELETLAQECRKPDDYLRIRERYCEVSFALNVHGLWAPAFRPEIPIPREKSDRQPAHQLVQQDRVVIDCHWLHCKKCRVEPTEARWRPLFKGGKDFPLVLAEEFASRGIPGEYRAEAILQLTHPQQVQLRALRGKAVQGMFESIKHSARVDGRRIPPRLEVIALAINRWAEKDRRVASEREKYMAHAKAHELLKPASPTRQEIASLAGLIRGVPALSGRTASDLLKKIERELAKSA